MPVPETVALCADPDVLGAPFYLMAFVDGVVLDKPEVLARLDPARARDACELLVDTLVRLHAVDPDAVGLGGFGRPEGFLARQVRRWPSSGRPPRPSRAEELARSSTALGADAARSGPRRASCTATTGSPT